MGSWAAESAIRRRHVPGATVGGRIAGTSSPSARSAADTSTARASSPNITGTIGDAALGLIIGGAIGNAVDRLVHGAVMDFVLFHITAAAWSFQWYVFNLADVAIVAGVVGLLYESLFAGDAAKAP